MDHVELLMASSSGTGAAGDANSCGPLEESNTGARTLAARGSLRILVVDDVADAANSFARLLRHLGHELATAYDGPAALQTAESFRPQVVFLDLSLPGLDGFEVARHLRREPSTQSACLIALSGHGQPADIDRAFQAGFDQHVLKPVSLSQLDDVLDRAARKLA